LAQGAVQEAAGQVFAEALQRRAGLSACRRQEGVDDLEEEVLHEVGVFLEGARGDEHLQPPSVPCLMEVEAGGLAGPLVAEDGDHLGVVAGGGAIEVDDAEAGCARARTARRRDSGRRPRSSGWRAK